MEFVSKNPKIYILSGKAFAGKNKVATYISDIYANYNKKTINLAYASYLKEYAKNVLNWDGNEETKPREFLQQLGVELIKKNIDDKMLIRRIVEDIKVYSYFYDIITISDARFEEEIETIRKLFKDVTVIHIYNLEDNNNLTSKQKNHSTEISLDHYNNYDYEINNNKTLEDLRNKIVDIIKEVNNE